MSKTDRNSGYYRKGQETRPLNELKHKQWKNFQWILDHVYQNSHFFKDKMNSVNLKPEDVTNVEKISKIPGEKFH